jgi:hypothetical protein
VPGAMSEEPSFCGSIGRGAKPLARPNLNFGKNRESKNIVRARSNFDAPV